MANTKILFLIMSWTSAFKYCCGQKKKPKEAFCPYFFR